MVWYPPTRNHSGSPIPETGDEDLLGPASGINPPGKATDPTYNTATSCWEFSDSADNVLGGIWQLSHKTDLTAPLEPHIHVINLGANVGTNSRWQLELNYAGIKGDLAAAYGSYAYDQTITVANSNSLLKHNLFYFPDLDVSALTVSATVYWKLSRLASSDADDDDTGAIALLSIDAHYKSYRFGHTLS